MSDMSQGPGWWQALDGKWYPPRSPAEDSVDSAATSALTTNPAMASSFVEAQSVPPLGSVGATPPTTSALLGDFSFTTSHPAGQRLRKRTSYWGVAVAVIVLVIGGIVTYSLTRTSQNAVPGASASQAVALASSAVSTAGSVHVATTFHVSSQTVTYTNDTAASSGEQVITSSGGAQVSAIVVHNVAYVRANQLALTGLFQAPSAMARQYANRWLSFGQSEQAFSQIAQTLTLHSLIQQIMPTNPLHKLAESTLEGRSVVGIRGPLPGGTSGTLFIAATGAPLPVEELTTSNNITALSTFGGWGEAINIKPPLDSIPGIPVASLFGGSSSSSDQAAQSNLTNALTEVLALYQNGQSYAPGGMPMTIGVVSSSAPEFAWTNGACDAASPNNCVSMQVVDASSPGDGQGIVLAVYSAGSGTCWYGLDLENPASPFTDTGANVAFTSPGRVPTGVTSPGTYYASKGPSQGVSPSTYCGANWAATRHTFSWGQSYSNPGAAA
jgi:hypothetical protein